MVRPLLPVLSRTKLQKVQKSRVMEKKETVHASSEVCGRSQKGATEDSDPTAALLEADEVSELTNVPPTETQMESENASEQVLETKPTDQPAEGEKSDANAEKSA